MEANIHNQAICLEKADDAFLFDLARAFAAYLFENYHKRDLSVAVGVGSYDRDEKIAAPIEDGLLYDGADVFDVFEVVAPAMFMATILDEFDCDGAIYVMNCQEICLRFYTMAGQLDDEELAFVLDLAKQRKWNHGKGGSMTKADLMSVYTEHLKNRLARQLPDTSDLHIVVDAQNGAGGFLATDVLAPLGINTAGSRNLERKDAALCPEPLTKEQIEQMKELITEQNADFGILASGDLSEMILLDSDGYVIDGDEEQEKEDAFEQVVIGSILDLISALDAKPKKEPSLGAYLDQVLQDLDNAFRGYQQGKTFVIEDKEPVILSFKEKDGRLILHVQGEVLPALRRKLFTFLDQYPSIDTRALHPALA